MHPNRESSCFQKGVENHTKLIYTNLVGFYVLPLLLSSEKYALILWFLILAVFRPATADTTPQNWRPTAFARADSQRMICPSSDTGESVNRKTMQRLIDA